MESFGRPREYYSIVCTPGATCPFCPLTHATALFARCTRNLRYFTSPPPPHTYLLRQTRFFSFFLADMMARQSTPLDQRWNQRTSSPESHEATPRTWHLSSRVNPRTIDAICSASWRLTSMFRASSSSWEMVGSGIIGPLPGGFAAPPFLEIVQPEDADYPFLAAVRYEREGADKGSAG